MTDGSRLPEPYGRLIDRDQEIDFEFEGKPLIGFRGDTIGSALYANGEKIVSRSFKYHRPRGFLSFSGYDANGYVQVGGRPNVIAETEPLTYGIDEITGQNRSGKIDKDRQAWMGLMSRFLPVGFYYRSFFGPGNVWPLYEKFFRAKAGLGKVDRSYTHETKDKIYRHTDVVVVGGGAAGLSAALAAADAGAEVILVEMLPELGGTALYCDDDLYQSLTPLVQEVLAHSNISIITSGFAQGLYEGNLLSVETPDYYLKIRAKAIALATGIYEQPIVFRGNDLPGVMLTSAARRLLWLYGVKPGTKAVLATVNDKGLKAALQLAKAGIEIKAIADLRPTPGPLHDELRAKGAEIYLSSAPYEALGSKKGTSAYFGSAVEALQLCHLGADYTPNPFQNPIDCDLVIMSGGYVPAVGLACHGGARLQYDQAIDGFRPDSLKPGVFLCGMANNIMLAGSVRQNGMNTGKRAAEFALSGTLSAADDAVLADEIVNHPYPIIPHPKGGEFVDFDEDLTIKDIQNAVADGFSLGELLKRYSTAGMGPSQGRQAAINVLRIAAKANDIPPSEMGTTTVRPPLRGESFAHLAGPHFHPVQYSPIQQRHDELEAVMMPAGAWFRPAHYGDENQVQDNVFAETTAVRESVGLIDVSTLGKIEVMGPDAARFLDRVYLTTHSTQKVDRSRYAIRCGSDGSIVDDGIVCRFDENFFYVTTTSGQSTPSYRHMTWLNAQWRMDVQITNVTGAYGAINIAGPKSREILEKLGSDIDFGAEAFPYIAARQGHLAGAPVRMVRAGFVGELGFEIHVPALYAASLWDRLMEAGRDDGIKPFGVLAQRLLRLEKGHVIVGQDTDGLTTPQEAGMGWAIPKKKQDYWGRAAIQARSNRELERTLVGFMLTGEGAPVPPECCLILEDGKLIGRVTSAASSKSCGGVIGLCFLHPDQAGEGTEFKIKMPNGTPVDAKVVPTPFYDPGNERQKL